MLRFNPNFYFNLNHQIEIQFENQVHHFHELMKFVKLKVELLTYN